MGRSFQSPQRSPVVGGAIAAAVLLAACSSPTESLSGTIVDCFEGAFFAECEPASSGHEPVLACSASDDDCRWFLGGQVPIEFPRVSECPADDLCCKQGFPFDPNVLEPSVAVHLSWALEGWATDPWDAQRAMNVAVQVGEPGVAVPFSCVGVDPFSGQSSSPCTGFTSTQEGRLLARDTIAMFPRTGGQGGWRPFIEIDPSSMRARVCVHPFTDYVNWQCPTEFTQARVVCATDGLITVGSLTEVGESFEGSVETTFADFSMSGSFAVQPDGQLQ